VIIETTRFGTVAYKKSEIVQMVRELLSFDEMRNFIIVSIRGQEPFKWLQSLDDPSLAFLMADPIQFKSDYVVEVHPHDLELLDTDNLEDVTVFVLVTIPQGQPDKMSINLQGPIIINHKNMLGAQLVLSDSGYGTRHSILRGLEKKQLEVAV